MMAQSGKPVGLRHSLHLFTLADPALHEAAFFFVKVHCLEECQFRALVA